MTAFLRTIFAPGCLLFILLSAGCAGPTSHRQGFASPDELSPGEREAYVLMRAYADCVFDGLVEMAAPAPGNETPSLSQQAAVQCGGQLDAYRHFLQGLDPDPRWVERQVRFLVQDVDDALKYRLATEKSP